MVEINLLPWRFYLAHYRAKICIIFFISALVVSMSSMTGIHFFLVSKTEKITSLIGKYREKINYLQAAYSKFNPKNFELTANKPSKITGMTPRSLYKIVRLFSGLSVEKNSQICIKEVQGSHDWFSVNFYAFLPVICVDFFKNYPLLNYFPARSLQYIKYDQHNQLFECYISSEPH